MATSFSSELMSLRSTASTSRRRTTPYASGLLASVLCALGHLASSQDSDATGPAAEVASSDGEHCLSSPLAHEERRGSSIGAVSALHLCCLEAPLVRFDSPDGKELGRVALPVRFFWTGGALSKDSEEGARLQEARRAAPEPVLC